MACQIDLKLAEMPFVSCKDREDYENLRIVSSIFVPLRSEKETGKVFDMMKKVNIISLGCSKNLGDTEMLLKQFDKAGYLTEMDAENSDADIVIVNTCGFIGDAKEESVNTILEQVERKKDGFIKQVYVIGCLSQRYSAELK